MVFELLNFVGFLAVWGVCLLFFLSGVVFLLLAVDPTHVWICWFVGFWPIDL